MHQVLLFDTALNTSNQGDEIIYEAVKDGLSPILDESLIFRMGTHVTNYSAYQLIRSEDRKIKRLCDWADYKFICGTNLLMDDVRGVNPQWMLNKTNARLYTDSILVGVGKHSDYESVHTHTRKIYEKIFSHDYAHSVRDTATQEIVESLGFRAINTGCPTLWGFTPEKCKAIPTEKAPDVIFSVSGYYKQRSADYDKKLIEILKKNYNKLYLWVQTVIDEKYFREIYDGEDIIPIYSLKKYREILRNEDVDYVGTRLHGGVFAMQNDCRSLVISIDDRARGFNASNNLNILEREKIEELENIMNGSIVTDIKLDRDAINSFVNQF